MKRIQVNHNGEYGKTEGEKDRERKIWGERGEMHSCERVWCGLISTVGLSQQHL
jgi:hypothetical protein